MKKIEQKINNIIETVEDRNLRKKIIVFLLNDTKIFSRKLVELNNKIEAQGFVSDEINKKYFLYASEILNKAEKLEKTVGERNLMKKIKNVFRKLLLDGPVYESSMVRRAYTKPKGYPGDYQIIELFYNNKPISKGIGLCGDKYILKDSYVSAVRKRKDYMKSILCEYLENAELRLINILNIGCGSCREIRELFKSDISSGKNVNITLIDQDEDALVFSRDSLANISNIIPENVKFNFLKENALNIFKKNEYKDILQGQDMIYSIGLTDYLPDIYLGRLIKVCFELLNPNGKLIFAHKNIKQYKALAPDWFCDWSFFPRSKKDIIDIVETYIDRTDCKVGFRENDMRNIFFTEISKS